jgi:hypothetical protein
LTGKILSLTRELIPRATKIGIISDRLFASVAGRAEIDAREAAVALGMQLFSFGAGSDGEIENAFAKLNQQRVDAIHVTTSPFFVTRAKLIADLATRHKLAATYTRRDGLDGLARPGTVHSLVGWSWDPPGHRIEPGLGVLLNPYTTPPSAPLQLFVSEPFNNTIAVINIVISGTAPNQVFDLGSVKRISSPSLKLPVDLAAVTRDADSNKWASNTTLDEGSDFYVANHGDNTIVRMRQDGFVVTIRRVLMEGREMGNASLNGITTSIDGSTIYVTLNGPRESPGGVLALQAF